MHRKHGTTSQQLERLTAHRTRQIEHCRLAASRRSIDPLVAEGIGTLCIGTNPLWKQEANRGRRNNRHVVAVPHARFLEMLADNAELVCIQLKITEQSSTSKTSLLDAIPPPVYGQTDTLAFSGRRVKRDL